MNTTVKTYTTVTALGADCVITNGIMYLKNFEPMLVKGLYPSTVVAPVTEQLQVATGTPTVANSTVYQISIQYTNRYTGNSETFTTTPFVSDATATDVEINNNLRAQLASQPQIPITGSGTTLLVFTGQTGFAGFTVTNIGPGVITFAPTTAAIWAVGLGSQIRQGNYAEPSAMASIVDASYYYQVEMNVANNDPVGTSQTKSDLINRNVLYVLSTATNISTLVGTYGTLTEGLQGVKATFNDTPVGTTPTLAYTTATGALALAGTGNTWAANGLLEGDVLYYPGAPTVYYPIAVQSTNTAGFSTAGNGADVSAAAFYTITLRKI